MAAPTGFAIATIPPMVPITPAVQPSTREASDL